LRGAEFGDDQQHAAINNNKDQQQQTSVALRYLVGRAAASW
jgi:hypothetical protein